MAQLPRDQLFLLTEGVIHGYIGGRALFYWQEGDLIGLQQGDAWTDCRLRSDGLLRLLPYRRTDLFRHLYAEPERAEQWLEYLLGRWRCWHTRWPN